MSTSVLKVLPGKLDIKRHCLHISKGCTWHEQIEYIKEKAWFRINIMRKFKFLLDRKSLETIYFSFIRPILEYGYGVWDNCTQQEKQDIEKNPN